MEEEQDVDLRGIPHHFVLMRRDLLFLLDRDSRGCIGMSFCGHDLFVEVSSDLLLHGLVRFYLVRVFFWAVIRAGGILE